MFNLYQRAKRGLVGRPIPSHQVRIHTTEARPGIHTYHVTDASGRKIALHRSDAVVIVHGLLTALKKTEGR